jgi:aminoglycoside 6'-N-acetyltransferase I
MDLKTGMNMAVGNTRIVDLQPGDEDRVHEAVMLLIDAFAQNPDYCPDKESALEEIQDLYDPGCIRRVAVDARGAVVGLIGGRPHYEGHVWEVHPLAVRPEQQGRGIGRALVADLEQRVGDRGGLTLWLGTDDEVNQTTLSAVDLYPNPLEHLARIQNLRGHPYEFYQKVGFVLVGVMPDANGWGKPDIFMAKRV